ncbi:MAG: hypothetical protein BroJett026_09740 [Betaproteobacteria bacterium]|nr:MAG: hypothetical protein BroJett026_09740 [Betaproteobacteria bacterium]
MAPPHPASRTTLGPRLRGDDGAGLRGDGDTGLRGDGDTGLRGSDDERKAPPHPTSRTTPGSRARGNDGTTPAGHAAPIAGASVGRACEVHVPRRPGTCDGGGSEAHQSWSP